MRRFFIVLMIILGVRSVFVSAMAAPARYDLLICNGRIIDGTGSPWYSGDIAIKDARIAALGRLGQVKAKRRIDARGETVTPGLINMLDQTRLLFPDSAALHPGYDASIAKLNLCRRLKYRPMKGF